MLDGLTSGLEDAGESTANALNAMTASAIVAAHDAGVITAEAVRQVVAGTVAGVKEVAKSHRRPATRRHAAGTRTAT